MFPRSMQEIFSLNNNKEVRALSFEVKLNNDGNDYKIWQKWKIIHRFYYGL